MSKKKKDQDGLVYSTNPNFSLPEDEHEGYESLPAGKQDLRVHLEKKHRGGKTVSIIDGYSGSEESLQELAKKLKSKCGTGGTVKDGQIIIQGDFREKILQLLISEGFRAKRGGG